LRADDGASLVEVKGKEVRAGPALSVFALSQTQIYRGQLKGGWRGGGLVGQDALRIIVLL
jgi:hypothetical protein